MSTEPRSVGILAGIFDPIHNGHVEIAKSALEYLLLTEVLFLVEKKGWGSKSPINIEKRREMVRLAIEDEPKISQMYLDEERFSLDKTLAKIESEFSGGELFFIFGGDVFMNMETQQWPDLNKLFKHNIVVYERASIKEEKISKHAKELGVSIAILESKFTRHSSTNVRLEPHKKTIWVSAKVAEYIDAQKLYE